MLWGGTQTTDIDLPEAYMRHPFFHLDFLEQNIQQYSLVVMRGHFAEGNILLYYYMSNTCQAEEYERGDAKLEFAATVRLDITRWICT